MQQVCALHTTMGSHSDTGMLLILQMSRAALPSAALLYVCCVLDGCTVSSGCGFGVFQPHSPRQHRWHGQGGKDTAAQV